MRKILWLSMFAMFIPFGWVRADIITPTTGIYDEQAVQANKVDRSATPYTVTLFTADVSHAFTRDKGGVINFDDALFSEDKTIVAKYGANHSIYDRAMDSATGAVPVPGAAGRDRNPPGVIRSN